MLLHHFNKISTYVNVHVMFYRIDLNFKTKTKGPINLPQGFVRLVRYDKGSL